MSNFLLSLLLCIVCVQLSAQAAKIVYPSDEVEEIGSKCTTPDNAEGICVPVSECSESIRHWQKKGQQVIVCKFLGVSAENVCCRKSEKYCFNYNNRSADAYGKNRTHIRNDSYGQFSFMAALGNTLGDTNIDYKCAGVLVSDKYVLTTASCVAFPSHLPNRVLIGETNFIQNYEINQQLFEIQRIIPHPDYKRNSAYNNVALVKLSHRAKIGQFIRPICLNTEDNVPSSDLTVIGYGELLSNNGLKANEIVTAGVMLTSNDNCQSYYHPEVIIPQGIIDSQLCAGDVIGNSCKEVSGGPVVSSIDGVKRAVGLFSFGKLCGTGEPSVFTRISSHVDWIQDVVWK